MLVALDAGARPTANRAAPTTTRGPRRSRGRRGRRAALSRDGAPALITVTPRHDPESPQARALVDRLRDAAGPPAAAHVEVGGATAQVEDFKDLVSGSMWKILLFVLAFSYLVLFVLLRSVLLPLKAVRDEPALGRRRLRRAGRGVPVGLARRLLGFESLGYINTMTPPFLLAIVFGLSMDYEVFLLTRIRERYDATGDTKPAVAQGLRGERATISSAALIMVAVFAVFAGTGVPSIKEIGLGLAVAIALDATLVRLVLVPATMGIMGEWNWWLPARWSACCHRPTSRAAQPAASRRSISAASSADRHAVLLERVAVAQGDGVVLHGLMIDGDARTACRSRPGGGSDGRSIRRCRTRPDTRLAQLLVDLAGLLGLPVLVHERQDGGLYRSDARVQPQHHAVLAFALLLIVGVDQERQGGAVGAGRRLDHVRHVALAGARIDEVELLAGRRGVAALRSKSPRFAMPSSSDQPIG